MSRTVVRSANGDDVFGVVATAFGARNDVVNVDEHCVGASRNATAMSISREHGTAHGGRNILFGASDRRRECDGTSYSGFSRRVTGALAGRSRGAHVNVIRGGCRSGVAGTRFNFGARQQWTDVLAIAFSHGHDRVHDGDELAAAEVASATSAADGERDLI
jgi:hypothetical protein